MSVGSIFWPRTKKFKRKTKAKAIFNAIKDLFALACFVLSFQIMLIALSGLVSAL